LTFGEFSRDSAEKELADIDGIGGAVLPALHKGIEVEGMTLPPLYIIQKGVLIGVTNQADNLGISRTIPLFIIVFFVYSE
jgi:hypothetical protein